MITLKIDNYQKRNLFQKDNKEEKYMQIQYKNLLTKRPLKKILKENQQTFQWIQRIAIIMVPILLQGQWLIRISFNQQP